MVKNLKETNCFEYEKNSGRDINAKTNKCEYFFDNSRLKYSFSKRLIDKCVIDNKTACDWLLLMDKTIGVGRDRHHRIFVELKDSDLIKAIDQIQNTIAELEVSDKEFTVHARVVLTKAYKPDIVDVRTQKFFKRIKAAGGTIDYKSQKLIESIIK